MIMVMILVRENMPDDFWGYRQEDGGCSYDVGVYPLVYTNFLPIAKHILQDMRPSYAKGYDDFMQSLITM